MKTFEKPLSTQEERAYLEKYRSGDEKAGEILIIRNMRLVAHVVKHYTLDFNDSSELISIGTVGLIKAVRSFDMSKGSRLATYAIRCIDNEILMYFRNEKKRYNDVSLQEPVGVDKEGNEISILDVTEAEGTDFLENYIKNADIRALYGLIDTVLSERERDIIIKRYGLYGIREQTQQELAKQLNISRSYVSRIEKKALEKLRDRLTNY